MKKSIYWLLPVLTGLVASVISVFLPVLTYHYPDGSKAVFNVFAFLEPSRELTDILALYNGPGERNVPAFWIAVLAVLAVAAIAAAFIGVITMSRQRPNTWQFIMTLAGLLGTAIPAFLIILAVWISKRFFPGTFHCGVYPIITPIAMVMCMVLVTRKHKKNQAELLAAERAKGLIRPGGDL